jgi:hypothetical protein
MKHPPRPDGSGAFEPTPDRFFPLTSWTFVQKAAKGGQDGGALNEFIDRYYAGIRAFIRAIVKDDAIADELTHTFIETRIIDSSRLLSAANQQRGRFRDLLKTALRHFVIDVHYRPRERERHSEVRPDGMPGSWDALDIESAFASADRALLRSWGESLLVKAIASTKQRCAEKGQHEHFEMFKRRYLDDPDNPPSFRDVGQPYHLDEKSARSRIVPVVAQFRAVLVELIKSDPDEAVVPEEAIQELLAVL